MKNYAKMQTDDRTINQLQDFLSQSQTLLYKNPIIDGSLLENISLSAGDNTVNHKLDRKLIGWIVTRIGAASQIYDKQASNPYPERTLILNSSAACTVSIYVF